MPTALVNEHKSGRSDFGGCLSEFADQRSAFRPEKSSHRHSQKRVCFWACPNGAVPGHSAGFPDDAKGGGGARG
jgi:hypothetical protein